MLRHLACVALALVAAGCLTPASTTSAPAAAAAPLRDLHGMPVAPLALAGADCVWGGGHSIHTHAYDDILPPPWKPADVIEDIGAQPSYSDPGEQVYGVATSGWGNWHTNLACRSWTLGGKPTPLTLGMVLTRVEPPPFDASPAHRHYIVNVFASDNAALNDQLMMMGWMSMGATGQLSWSDGTFHHVLGTEMHGTYESLFRTKDAGAWPDDVIRLWFQRENDDKTFTPIAIDMRFASAHGIARAQSEGEGYFSHTGTDDHALLLGEPSGTAGQIPGLVASGFDASFAWGPMPAVKLDKAYAHL